MSLGDPTNSASGLLIVIGLAGLIWIGSMIAKGHEESQQREQWKEQEAKEDKNAIAEDAYSKLIFGQSGVKLERKADEQPSQSANTGDREKLPDKPKEPAKPYKADIDNLFD
jgi:hypothetical protein